MSNEKRRPYWNMEVETKLNTPEMREYQLKKLKERLEFLKGEAGPPFWKKELKDVTPKNINSREDYAKAVPVFDKQKFRSLAAECDMDMDRVLYQLMGEKLKDVRIMSATSGTTGEPTPYPLTPEDLYLWREYCSRMAWRCGIYPGSRMIQAFGLSMFLAGVPMVMAYADYGCSVLPVGAEAGSERALFYMRFFKPSSMTCTPSFAGYLVDKANDILGEGELKNLGIRQIICGGEPGAGIPEVRRKIEDGFGAKLYDGGAGLGVSCDHPEYQGMHNICDDFGFSELVDPDTGMPVPWEDGAIGLGVSTTLIGNGMAGVRQTMGDLHQVFIDQCPCGKTGYRYKIVGRTDDMLKIKGVMVYPPAITDVITQFRPQVTGEYRIVLDEPPPRVVPPIKLKIERGVDFPESKLEELAGELEDKFHRVLKLRPKIIWIEPNTLERSAKKTQLFEKAWLDKDKK
jgi:phenylacetate-CoA ligase